MLLLIIVRKYQSFLKIRQNMVIFVILCHLITTYITSLTSQFLALIVFGIYAWVQGNTQATRRQQKPEVKYHHITETWKISIEKK